MTHWFHQVFFVLSNMNQYCWLYIFASDFRVICTTIPVKEGIGYNWGGLQVSYIFPAYSILHI